MKGELLNSFQRFHSFIHWLLRWLVRWFVHSFLPDVQLTDCAPNRNSPAAVSASRPSLGVEKEAQRRLLGSLNQIVAHCGVKNTQHLSFTALVLLQQKLDNSKSQTKAEKNKMYIHKKKKNIMKNKINSNNDDNNQWREKGAAATTTDEKMLQSKDAKDAEDAEDAKDANKSVCSVDYFVCSSLRFLVSFCPVVVAAVGVGVGVALALAVVIVVAVVVVVVDELTPNCQRANRNL